MGTPVVYGPAESTHVWSVRLALAEKGVAHRLVPVAFGAEREEPHLQRHPFGKVPAFEHEDFALYETQAILRYIDERFAGLPLQPEDVFEWSRMNQLIGIHDAYAYPAIGRQILWNHRLIPHVFGQTLDEGAIAAGLPRARLALSEIARLMGEERFLAGPHVSLADLLLFPLLYYFSRIPEGETALDQQSNLKQWLARIEGRQSVAVTRPRPI
jgi:glutathione S-transferase